MQTNTAPILDLIRSQHNKWHNRENLNKALSLIDLTSLNTTDTKETIINMVEKVNNFSVKFPHLNSVAAICVYPNFAKHVKENLKIQNIKIAVVGGVFPNSQSFLEVKELECKIASENGVDEVDIVLPLHYFLANDYDSCKKEISQIKNAIGKAHLKVILETGALKNSEQIYKASMISMEAGADFIKTSTGKMEPAATPEAAVIMCMAIKDYYHQTGKKIGFKPAGGIVTTTDAIEYLAIVDSILGEEWLNNNLFRLGASRLTNNILTELEEQEIKYF